MKKLVLGVLSILVLALVGAVGMSRCMGADPGESSIPVTDERPAAPTTADFRAFMSRLEAKPPHIRGEMFSTRRFGQTWTCEGTFVRTRDPTRLVEIFFACSPSLNQPTMQFRLAFPVQNAFGMTLPQEGSFTVLADFDAGETDLVFRRGIPDALIDAMLAAADERGWLPRVPTEDLEYVVIDPGPYLGDGGSGAAGGGEAVR